jgi:hypothetical protein
LIGINIEKIPIVERGYYKISL